MTGEATAFEFSTAEGGFNRARAPSIALFEFQQGGYVARLARNEAERLAAFRLRFLVFNLELAEGLDTAYQTGHDTDEFDAACDHLIVEHIATQSVVGTYRLQTGTTARRHSGYYSEREFNFAPYESLSDQIVELGRACIHREHRSTDVLYLLWRGIAQYAVNHGRRYLIGCCSLTSQNAAEGMAVFQALGGYLVDGHLRTEPQPGFATVVASSGGAKVDIPKLLRTYLAIGARICGPPAMDRDFKTIDFLTLLDLATLHPRVRTRFLERR